MMRAQMLTSQDGEVKEFDSFGFLDTLDVFGPPWLFPCLVGEANTRIGNISCMFTS